MTTAFHFDAEQLAEVLDEIAGWSLQQRRDYISEIGKVFGEEAAKQITDGLAAIWAKRK